MLLRSITKHIKDQNWFAVALDFVIVVIGVFIGIQVANWNEVRLVRQEQRAFLEQLYADLAPRIEYWRSGNEAQTLVDQDERFVLDSLLSGTLAEADVPRFDRGLVALVDRYSVDISLLQRRMESTEIFSEFQGTPYEDILVSWHRTWAVSTRLIADNEARGGRVRDIVFRRVLMVAGPYVAPETAELLPRYEFDELAADDEFIHAVAQLYHLNNVARSVVYRTFYDIDETVNQLEAALYPDGNTPELPVPAGYEP